MVACMHQSHSFFNNLNATKKVIITRVWARVRVLYFSSCWCAFRKWISCKANFKVMLMNPRWNESREQRIVLQEAAECVEVFELFLRYLYTGRLKVSHATVLPTLALADKYNVKVSSWSLCLWIYRDSIKRAI